MGLRTKINKMIEHSNVSCKKLCLLYKLHYSSQRIRANSLGQFHQKGKLIKVIAAPSNFDIRQSWSNPISFRLINYNKNTLYTKINLCSICSKKMSDEFLKTFRLLTDWNLDTFEKTHTHWNLKDYVLQEKKNNSIAPLIVVDARVK